MKKDEFLKYPTLKGLWITLIEIYLQIYFYYDFSLSSKENNQTFDLIPPAGT